MINKNNHKDNWALQDLHSLTNESELDAFPYLLSGKNRIQNEQHSQRTTNFYCSKKWDKRSTCFSEST